MKKDEGKEQKDIKQIKRFSKKQFLNSDQFTNIEKDILKIILDDNKKYSMEEVKEKLQGFKKREVKKLESMGNSK